MMILSRPLMFSLMRSCSPFTSQKNSHHLLLLRRHRATTLFQENVLDSDNDDVSGTHTPVLLKEIVEHFHGCKLRSFVDCTLGGGGHACAIIKAHPELETFIGMDVDPVALAQAKPRIQATMQDFAPNLKLTISQTNFKDIDKLPSNSVDGILMDLGVSSMQVTSPERGFSYHLDGPIDMRMDPNGSLKAEDILNDWPESEICRILRDYGEEPRWRYLARKIVDSRISGIRLRSTAELVNFIGGRRYTGDKAQKMKRHPAMRTFQALRIAVNDELNVIEGAVSTACSCLSSGGRLAVISFHSLEDRIVKHSFLNLPHQSKRAKNKYRRDDDSEVEEEGFRIVTKKPVVPSEDEIRSNPRCKSAKLRVIHKL